MGTHKMLSFGYLSHLIFHVHSYGENGFAQLPVIYLGKKIRLVLNRVGTRCEPLVFSVPFGLRIMPGSNKVISMSGLLVERSKFNQSIAHDIRIWCISRHHFLHSISCHLLPILLMAVDNIEMASISRCY